MRELTEVKLMAVSFDTDCPYCGRGDGNGNHAADCPVPEPFKVISDTT